MRAGPAETPTPAVAFPAAPFGWAHRLVHSEPDYLARRFGPVRAEDQRAAEQPACPEPLGRAAKRRLFVPACRDVPVVRPALRQEPPGVGRQVQGAAGSVAALLVAPIDAVAADFAAAPVPRQRAHAAAGAPAWAARRDVAESEPADWPAEADPLAAPDGLEHAAGRRAPEV